MVFGVPTQNFMGYALLTIAALLFLSWAVVSVFKPAWSLQSVEPADRTQHGLGDIVGWAVFIATLPITILLAIAFVAISIVTRAPLRVIPHSMLSAKWRRSGANASSSAKAAQNISQNQKSPVTAS